MIEADSVMCKVLVKAKILKCVKKLVEDEF